MMSRKEQDPIFPRNRKEVFFDLFKHHKNEMLISNLWFLLFAFLTVALLYTYYIYGLSFQTSAEEEGFVLPTTSDGTPLTIDQYLFSIRTLFYLGLLVTDIPLFIGLGGFVNVIQKLVFAETFSKVTKEFFAGVKKNLKQYISLSFLFSIVFVLCTFVIDYYLLFGNGIIGIISIGLCVLAMIIVFVSLPFAICASNIYNASFLNVFKTGLGLFFAKWYKHLGIFVLLIIPFLFFLIPSIYFVSAWMFVILLIYPPILILVLILTFNSIADDRINREKFPEIYRKGIFTQEDNDKNRQ